MRIELPPEGVSIVKTNSRQWVSATLLEDKTRYADVGLHLKGQGTFQPLEKKPNFVLKMNQFVPGQRLWGLRKLMYVERLAQLRNSALKQQDWDERIKQLVSLIRPVLYEYDLCSRAKSLFLISARKRAWELP